MIPCGDLAKLELLDRELLHVFVAGPGRGESVVVALPTQGWVVLDSCTTRPASIPKNNPAIEILAKWKSPAESVEWLILTHPHTDHVEGFVDLLERAHPDSIGVTGFDTAASILKAFEEWRRESGTTDETLAKLRVEASFRAIQTRNEAGTPITSLHAGVVLPTSCDDLELKVVAPDRGNLEALLAVANWRQLKAKANELSTVLQIVFGKTQLLLGGDFPLLNQNKQEITPGWESIHKSLGQHHAFKLPHHGSDDAIPWRDLNSAGTPVAWWVTPYSSSSLPRLDVLKKLVAVRSPVRQTAVSTSKGLQIQKPSPASYTLQQLEQHAFTGASGFLSDAIELSPPLIDDPLAPVWCTAFDSLGCIQHHWRGEVAFEIV